MPNQGLAPPPYVLGRVSRQAARQKHATQYSFAARRRAPARGLTPGKAQSNARRAKEFPPIYSVETVNHSPAAEGLDLEPADQARARMARYRRPARPAGPDGLAIIRGSCERISMEDYGINVLSSL